MEIPEAALKKLARAKRHLNGLAEPDDELGWRVIEYARTRSFEEWKKAAEEAGIATKAAETRNQRLERLAESALREASRLCQEAAGISAYEARRATVALFNRSRPDQGDFRLFPERTLEGTAALKELRARYPHTQPPSPEYRHLIGQGVTYWRDPVYARLAETAAGLELPEGAIPALLPLIKLSVRPITHEGESGVPVMELLPRFGIRLAPYLVDLLASPEKYIDYTGFRVFPAPLVTVLPEDLALAFFRAGLEGGWREIGADLPEGRRSLALWQEFQDSPYGPPYRPAWIPRQ